MFWVSLSLSPLHLLSDTDQPHAQIAHLPTSHPTRSPTRSPSSAPQLHEWIHANAQKPHVSIYIRKCTFLR